MELSVIIVNWNSAAYLRKCLRSVFATAGELRFEVIVVDNASFDGCGEMIAKEYPAVTFIPSETNLGFSGANNLGFLHSSGRKLLFLNPDTEVHGDALRAMCAETDRLSDAGAVGTKLLNTDGTVQMSCIQRFPTIWNLAIDADLLRDAFPGLGIWGTSSLLATQRVPVSVEVISGACLMIRREVFERVGRFTTQYFMYSEDVDLCFKCRRMGYRNYYLDRGSVVHHGGGSTKENGDGHFSAIVMRESLLKFFVLRRGPMYAALYRVSVTAVSLVRCALLACRVLVGARGNTRLRNALSRWRSILKWSLGVRPSHAWKSQ